MYCEHINESTKQIFGLTAKKYDGYIEVNDIEQAYNGQWYIKGYTPEKPAPTEEEQRQKRAEAYRVEVDPITSQISRLRDEEQTTEIIEKINELLQKRNELVVDIQERYPYPVGE